VQKKRLHTVEGLRLVSASPYVATTTSLFGSLRYPGGNTHYQPLRNIGLCEPPGNAATNPPDRSGNGKHVAGHRPPKRRQPSPPMTAAERA
jgi:hypothetical protein